MALVKISSSISISIDLVTGAAIGQTESVKSIENFYAFRMAWFFEVYTVALESRWSETEQDATIATNIHGRSSELRWLDQLY